MVKLYAYKVRHTVRSTIDIIISTKRFMFIISYPLHIIIIYVCTPHEGAYVWCINNSNRLARMP